MDREIYTVLALPHSFREDDDVHVSLFVTPRLTPTRDGEELRRSRLFREWARGLRGARFELADQSGDIDCEPHLDAVEPRLWSRVFGPRTPVRGQAVPRWQDRTWRSFDTRNVTALAKVTHLATMYAAPTAPPAPAGHPLTAPLLEALGRGGWAATHGTVAGDLGGYDERRVTRALDAWLAEQTLESLARARDASVGQGGQALVLRMAQELHRARRFYERPESQQAYQERPTPGAEHPPLPSPEPEFHERVAACGDHPALLRALGLVVDLRADTGRLATSTFLTGRIVLAEDETACRSPRVRCTQTADRSLVTVPAGPDWAEGALKLGDERRFTVHDVDADGSALKTERFLWTLPRLLEVSANHDPAHAATPALRASGFTVARTDQALGTQRRIERQTELEAGLEHVAELALTTEDVTRGLRIEVWDETAGRWFSLHRRRTDVVVEGAGTVIGDLAEEGFVQGTAAHETPGVDDSPIHVHEAMFGWEGWSLSAPRPGRRIRAARPGEATADGRSGEVVEETGPLPGERPPHPVSFVNTVEPGTLPRLRFGRSYAFRAWAVDLAGNSRPHELNPAPTAPETEVASAVAAQVTPGPREVASLWSGRFRQVTAAALAARDVATSGPTVTGPTATGPTVTGPTVTGPTVTGPPALTPGLLADLHPGLHPGLLEVLGPRLRGLGDRRTPGGRAGGAEQAVGRRALVEAATTAAVADDRQPLVLDPAVTAPERLTPLVRSHLAAFVAAGTLADQAVHALATVTRLRPFLRWDPVPPPAVVPRRRFSDGESLRVLVVRSGVTQDPDTLEITVTGPADYADQVRATHPDLPYFGTSERHLAAPKTTQMTAELHGMFDSAIGSSSAADIRAMLGWAIAEDGSLSDVDRADLDHPPQRVAQPGVRLEVSADVPQATPKELPLPPGEAPAPGQYVVHDTDDLTLPYLPDPLARGVSFVFPEAGRDRHLPLPYGGEGFTAAYGGEWPRIEPYRLVLRGAGELGARVEGRTVRMRLPAGDVQRVRLSSSLAAEDLPLLGVWRSFPPLVQGDPDVAEAAKDGWLWGLTPADEVTLVHAVPRPLTAPRPTLLRAVRAPGASASTLVGGVDVHGASTDSLVAEAAWQDPVDDVGRPSWHSEPSTVTAFRTAVGPEEELAVLGPADGEVDLPGVGRLRLHQAVHQLGDTRHRMVGYRFRASTRFREFFRPELLTPAYPGDDGRSVVAAPVVVDVPSSAPPAAPVVHSVIPLFRWDFGPEAEQPMARRHVRRAGLRIYLERPWFSSGEGELLAVLLAPGSAGDGFGPPSADGSGYPFVSKIGQDPLWVGTPVERRAVQPLQLDDLLRVAFPDDPAAPGRPVRAPETRPLTLGPGSPDVVAVGYRPQYNAERRLWYVDVAFDPGTAFWPFVRLAVARYQPSSVAGCHLSAPVRCDDVQLPPERTVSVSRTDARHVRVVVSGPVGVREGHVDLSEALPPRLVDVHRLVVARLQTLDPLIDTDLGWRTVSTARLTIRGTGRSEAEAAWVGELGADEDVVFRRPLDPPVAGAGPAEKASPAPSWRVTVEEWERLPGDLPAPSGAGPLIAVFPQWEQRLVFADEVLL